MSRKSTAQGFRDIAREFERYGRAGIALAGNPETTIFTCVAVGCRLGSVLRLAYAETFEVNGSVTENAAELWLLPDVRDVRVLMLCFAAAMAETGDLA